MTIIIPGHFLVAVLLNALLAAWVFIPRPRDAQFLNLAPVVRFFAGIFGTLILWIVYLVWRLYA